MIRDLDEFRGRKARSALMFAERALDDARASYSVEPSGPVASAIGHLSCAVDDLRAEVARLEAEAA